MSILYQNFFIFHLLRYGGMEGNCSRLKSVGRGGSPIFPLRILGSSIIPKGASNFNQFFIFYYFLPSVEVEQHHGGMHELCFYNAPPFNSKSQVLFSEHPYNNNITASG